MAAGCHTAARVAVAFFAIVARVGIEDMFIGGLLPALLMFGIVAIWGVRQQPPSPERAGLSGGTVQKRRS